MRVCSNLTHFETASECEVLPESKKSKTIEHVDLSRIITNNILYIYIYFRDTVDEVL